MEINESQKQHIRESFKAIKSKNDFLQLLNYAKEIIYGKKTFPFELKQITYYSNTAVNTNRYARFTVPKKSGGRRIIHAPVKGLKRIHACLNIILQTIYEPYQHPAATGFVPGKSTVGNAIMHVGAYYVYNIDLKDFFHSVHQGRLWGRLKHPPFNLDKNARLEINNIISSLCCHAMETSKEDDEGQTSLEFVNVLPQGAATSPVITNIICQRLDFFFSAVAKRFGLTYSRYADDITFSSKHNVYQKDGDFQKEIERLVKKEGFDINQKKVRLQRTGYRQEVTGLVVNEKVNVNTRFIKNLRMWLYMWEHYEYEKASELFFLAYKDDKGNPLSRGQHMREILRGKLNYLKMVRGAEDPAYKKLADRFKRLLVNKQPSEIPRSAPEKSSTKTEEQSSSQALQIFPHDPFYTVKFLKSFKIADGSGFKELVHDVTLTDDSIQNMLDQIKRHPNFKYKYFGERVPGLKYLNVGIQKELVKLVDTFERVGIPYFKRTTEHPFGGDDVYTAQAKKFKKMYRYGSGNEYSRFHTDILKAAHYKDVPEQRIVFLPDPRIFSIRASFFTWQPSVTKGLKYIMEGIADHSNVLGEPKFKTNEKEIQIEAAKVKAGDMQYIEITILDKDSICLIDSQKLLEFMKDSSAYKVDFRNLCDWIIECDFMEESSRRLNILTLPVTDLPAIEEIPEPVGGFKHILRFYDN